jgi:hypothetical protein
MFRYNLRTLLIVLALAPPLLAGAFKIWQLWPIPDQCALVGRSAVMYGSRWNGPYESVEGDTNSLDCLRP